jgi:hypothetical protein
VSKRTQVVCDVCGAVKRDVNHWWKVQAVEGALLIAKFDDGLDDAVDVCGQEHVILCVNRYMDHGNLEERNIEQAGVRT